MTAAAARRIARIYLAVAYTLALALAGSAVLTVFLGCQFIAMLLSGEFHAS